MIKAIQTRYAGYLFRSRLEARWAVFFDALELDWKYEPEGFELSNGARYLPDFMIKLRGRTLWVEIKPDNEASEKLEKFISSAPEDSNWMGVVLNDIPDPRIVGLQENGNYYGDDRPYAHFAGGGWDNFYRFCVCASCGEVGFEFDGRSARIGCGCPEHSGYDKNYTGGHSRIVSAFAKARAARFEHEDRETYE